MKTHDIHREIESWMAGALCGGLTAEELTHFERHLAECEACRSLYREEQLMNTMLEKELGASRPGPEFGDAMVSRFRERVGQKRRSLEWMAALGRIAVSRPAQAVYAVLLLAAMVKTGSVMTGERFPQAALQSAEREADGLPAERHVFETHGLSRQRLATAKNAADSGGIILGDVNTYTGATEVAAGETAARLAPVTVGKAQAQLGSDAVGGRILDSKKESAKDQFAYGINDAADKSAQAESSTPAPEENLKLIRNATVQYEVISFAKAADIVASLTGEAQGYISTQNSNRGANGKLEGTIEAKIPPAHLDAFLLKLRVLGDLKNQTLATQDVTKDYFDTSARMRNAQLEEDRLLDILKKNTGKLNELLQVERELARVRQSIEEMQGTLKYYDTMVSYATVTIGLSEKDLNAPAKYLLKQRADLSIFAADVEATFARAKETAIAAKAQIVDSNVERNPDGQTTATLSLLIDPAAADSVIAQLKTLGRIQDFTSHTERVAQDGQDQNSPSAAEIAGTEKDKVEAHLTVLQDEETAAQQTDVSVLTPDVEARMAELKKQAAELGAAVKGASFERDPSGTETGTVQLRMPLRAYEGVLAAVRTLGEVKSLSVQRQEGPAVTDSAPALMSVQIYSEARIVSDENGVWPTMRRTLGEAFSAVMWSVRMIGVSLAFFAPWLLALTVVAVVVKMVRRFRRGRKAE